ncbi:30S ribosomal protein S17 [Patescibacteria group bacterium]|nr:30S ribosomal protein S17 [Patescibacteria group bacterium]MCL5010562.1 30S ribosomal protein S17 [Patescibacteria group bacterium]
MNKILKGKVISVKMNKTAVVRLETKSPHPVYRKIMTKSKKYKVYVEDKMPSVGDKVRIIETRPLSKDKHFRLMVKGEAA